MIFGFDNIIVIYLLFSNKMYVCVCVFYVYWYVLTLCAISQATTIHWKWCTSGVQWSKLSKLCYSSNTNIVWKNSCAPFSKAPLREALENGAHDRMAKIVWKRWLCKWCKKKPIVFIIEISKIIVLVAAKSIVHHFFWPNLSTPLIVSNWFTPFQIHIMSAK